ncbi:unnamed protein product [Phytophthora fragariaefolia]|uniref:Unnamed protein product n=1 Tax=Phytophthora fragariaefolia TaxID=1490495 RepID=A0A9W7CXS0_9STRA|nr:unnamed protein product [Phytophthora fragariaefolia]
MGDVEVATTTVEADEAPCPTSTDDVLNSDVEGDAESEDWYTETESVANQHDEEPNAVDQSPEFIDEDAEEFDSSSEAFDRRGVLAARKDTGKAERVA